MSAVAHPINAQRLHQLNAIKRFLQSSQPLLLIVGEQDSGKTKLLSDVVMQMRLSRRIIRIQGTPSLYPAQFVNVLSKQWKIECINQQQRIEAQLDQMLMELTNHAQVGILVIDDAHLLSLSVLAAISHLVTQQDGKDVRLHILLTGRPALSEKINTLQTKQVAELTVGALSREDSFRKIKRLFDNAGLHLPHAAANAIFTKLYQRSQGMPKTLENMVNKLIVQRGGIDQPVAEKLEKSQPILTVPDNILSRFWQAHRIKTFSLVSLAVLGYFFWAWQHHHLQPHIWPKPIIHSTKPPLKPPPTKPIISKPLAPYTLQVMSGMNINAMKHYIGAHHLAHQAHIMQTQYKGHDWYVLTYGQYRQLSQAKSALAMLPKAVKSRHPWVRPTKQLLPIGGPQPSAAIK